MLSMPKHYRHWSLLYLFSLLTAVPQGTWGYPHFTVSKKTQWRRSGFQAVVRRVQGVH